MRRTRRRWRAFRLGALACKVYVRRPADLPIIQAQLAPALAAGARFVYLQADICRQDLRWKSKRPPCAARWRPMTCPTRRA